MLNNQNSLGFNSSLQLMGDMIMKFKKIIAYVLLIIMLGLVSVQYSKIESIIKTVRILEIQIQKIIKDISFLLINIDPKPDIEKSITSTVQLKVGRYGGAGVIIKDDGEYLYILTAKHIVTPKGKVEIVITNLVTNKKTYIEIIPRKNIYIDEEVDLALIKLLRPEGRYSVISLAEKEPKIGETIYTVGHPIGTYYTVNIGIVSNYIKNPFVKRKGTYMLISAPSIFGNSGGAVINNKTEVVGIASGIMWLGKNPKDIANTVYVYHMTFAIRLDDIKNLLKSVK